MIVGYVDVLSRAWIVGWACDLAEPERELDVAISVDGRQVAIIRADLPREDLRSSGKYGSGRHGFTFAFRENLSLDRSHRIRAHVVGNAKPLNNGEHDLAPVDVKAIADRLDDAPYSRLKPVFLTHVPRSGSTFVMDVLSRHPAIVAATHYPYEVKVGSYYANAAHVLCNAADFATPVNPTEFMRDSSTVSFNPFDHFNFRDVFDDQSFPDYFFRWQAPRLIGELFRSLTKQYYMCIALDKGLSPSWFVEKCELDWRLQRKLGNLFPGRREIVLVRDMRDVYCSYLKYFKNTTKDYAMKVITNSSKHLVRIVSEDSPHCIQVRYEDCVTNPDATFDRIWQFLGVPPLRMSGVTDNDRLFSIHATSGSVAASIGRWRHDLTDAEKRECSINFGEFLTAFGYGA